MYLKVSIDLLNEYKMFNFLSVLRFEILDFLFPQQSLLLSGGSRGRVWVVRTPPPPHIRPDACLRLKFLHRQHRIQLINRLIFLMKHALHFATKLNSKGASFKSRIQVHSKRPRNYKGCTIENVMGGRRF